MSTTIKRTLHGQRRYLTAGSTAVAFSSMANGRVACAYAKSTVSEGSRLLLAGSNLSGVLLEGHRGTTFTFFGKGSATASWRLWALLAVGSRIVNPVDLVVIDARFWASGTITLGAGTGAAGDTVVLPTELVADESTFELGVVGTTPRGYAEHRQTAWQLGTTSLLSPANDAPAELVVPDFGPDALGWAMDLKIETTVTELNCAYALTR